MDRDTGIIREVTAGAPIRSTETLITEAERRILEQVPTQQRPAKLAKMRGEIVQRPRSESRGAKTSRMPNRAKHR